MNSLATQFLTIKSETHGEDTPAAKIRAIPWQLALTASEFQCIDLEEIEAVSLANRFDIKFCLTFEQIERILPLLKHAYRMLTVQGYRLQEYQNLYFDTPAFDLYHLHVNNRAHQYKVRIREYASTHQTFLEVKHKNNRGLTMKNRLPVDPDLPFLGSQERNWLAENLPESYLNLEPKLVNTFTRIILADSRLQERVTLDFNLGFSSGWKVERTGCAAIAEVKLETRKQPSLFLEIIHSCHQRSTGFSKYGIGVALLYDQVKSNSLKSRLLWLKRINGGF